MSQDNFIGCVNTDRELWREREGDFYADSVHITQTGGLGINCGGYVYVKYLREWHKLAEGKFNLKRKGIVEQLRETCEQLRRTPMSLKDLIPLLQQAADELDEKTQEATKGDTQSS